MQTEVAISTAGLLDVSLFPSLVSLWPAALSKGQSLKGLGDAAAGPDSLKRLMSAAPATSALTIRNHTGSNLVHWLGGPHESAAPTSGADHSDICGHSPSAEHVFKITICLQTQLH